MSENVEGARPEEGTAVPRPGVSLLGAVAAEVVGTFLLVFIGAGTVVALNRPIGGGEEPLRACLGPGRRGRDAHG